MEQIQSEQVNELFLALSKAQGEMMPAIKDSKNPFFKSNFADLKSVWSACREPLSKNGLCVSQSIMVEAGVNVLVTVLGHKSGQWIKSVAPIIVVKLDAQSFGSAITYQRRYALSALVGIYTDEDDDGETAQNRPPQKHQASPSQQPKEYTKPSQQQAAELTTILGECAESYRTNILKGIGNRGWKTVGEMPIEAYTALRTEALQKRAEYAATFVTVEEKNMEVDE